MTQLSTEPAAQTTRPKRRLLYGLLRMALGGAVIALLLVRSDLGSIARAITNARPGFIVAAFGSMLAMLVVGAFRWQLFLRSLGMPLPRWTLLRLYLVGTFFNAFLPTGVGGDAYKAMRLRAEPGSLGVALASVMLDRASGLVALAMIGLVGAGAQFAAGDHGRVVGAGAALAILVLGGTVAALALGQRLRGRPQPVGVNLRERIAGTLRNAVVAARDRRVAGTAIFLGLIVQGLLLLANVLLAAGMRIDVPIAAVAALLVIVSLAAALPLSINGVGFREAAYVWSLGAYGVGHDRALAFALLMLGLLLATSAVGAVVYVVAGGSVDRAERPISGQR